MIAAEVAASTDRDPQVIAARIAMRLSAKNARVALAEVLATYVRVHIGTSRMHTYAEVAADQVDASQAMDEERPVSRWERHARLLGEGIFVAGAWKTLGECTATDFDWLAADREARAVEIAQAASRFRAHAADIRAAGVSTFGDLYAISGTAVAA